MEERNLDWKKVFKEILGSSSDRERLNPAENMLSKECKDSDACHDTGSYNITPTECEYNESDDNSLNESFENMSVAEKDQETCTEVPASSYGIYSSTYNGKVPEWNKVFKEILGKKSNLNTQEKSVIKHSPEDQIPSWQRHDSSQKQAEQLKNMCYSNTVKSDKTFKCKDQIPSWQRHDTSQKQAEQLKNMCYSKTVKSDKTFKSKEHISFIEKTNASQKQMEKVKDECYRKNTMPCYPKYKSKKPDSSQKEMEKARNGCYRKNAKPQYKIYKSKSDEEAEEETNEIFRRSRLFSFKCPYKNINELDGSGVNLYKYKRSLLKYPPIPPEMKEFIDNDSEPLYSDNSVKKKMEVDYPLRGFVAKMKYITREDILNDPPIQIDEYWDDDLLF